MTDREPSVYAAYISPERWTVLCIVYERPGIGTADLFDALVATDPKWSRRALAAYDLLRGMLSDGLLEIAEDDAGFMRARLSDAVTAVLGGGAQ